jgi:hypothetical protein
MRNIKITIYSVLMFFTFSCTGDFDEINTNNQGFEASDLSAKFFVTEAQFKLYAPDRYPYWRAHLIHTDRYAGHFTFGSNVSWWNDGLGYTYSGGYTDAAWGWLAGYFGNVKSFMDLTKTGGEFENENMYAMGLIMKSLYYQMYTDTFGMIPFSEAGIEGILTPKYDSQKDIYKGVIADLDEAMTIIGSKERTGNGVADVAENDVYCGGDLQKWKRLANTLKLRIGMRALGATGDDFATNAINSALSSPLLDASTGSVTMEKDIIIGQWGSAAYGDVWHSFGAGSDWSVGATLINQLKSTQDPRLSVYASPAKGGEFTFEGTGADYQQRLDFLIATLDNAGATYTTSTSGDITTINLDAGQYIGQPTRLNGDIKPMVKFDMFSPPGQLVTQKTGEGVGTYPEIILTSAEAYFLQAEAALRGIGSGDAQGLFADGIRQAMKLWDISDGDIENYISSQDAANISTGTLDEKLEKIAIQRWLVSYTDGFEAWAVVRDTGYPSELAQGVSNSIIYELGTLSGAYPQRLRYGSGAQNNPNYGAAVSEQGPDVQATKLWYAK